MQAIKAMFDLTAALIHALNIYSCLRERSTKMETATEFKNSYVLTYETSIISLKKEEKKEKKKVELFYISSFYSSMQIYRSLELDI